MGPTGCPETPVRNYNYPPRNNPEEGGSQVFSPLSPLHFTETVLRNSWPVWTEFFSLIAPEPDRNPAIILKMLKSTIAAFQKPQSWRHHDKEPVETLLHQTVHAVLCNNATGMLYLILSDQENSASPKLCTRHCNGVPRTDESDEADEKARFTMNLQLYHTTHNMLNAT